MTVFSFLIPIKIKSAANLREHWGARMRRAKRERGAAAVFYRGHILDKPSKDSKISVTLARRSARLLDSDNLASAFKSIRDGIADALGINDGDMRITWNYEQEKAKKGEETIAVRIEFDPVGDVQ